MCQVQMPMWPGSLATVLSRAWQHNYKRPVTEARRRHYFWPREDQSGNLLPFYEGGALYLNKRLANRLASKFLDENVQNVKLFKVWKLQSVAAEIPQWFEKQLLNDSRDHAWPDSMFIRSRLTSTPNQKHHLFLLAPLHPTAFAPFDLQKPRGGFGCSPYHMVFTKQCSIWVWELMLPECHLVPNKASFTRMTFQNSILSGHSQIMVRKSDVCACREAITPRLPSDCEHQLPSRHVWLFADLGDQEAFKSPQGWSWELKKIALNAHQAFTKKPVNLLLIWNVCFVVKSSCDALLRKTLAPIPAWSRICLGHQSRGDIFRFVGRRIRNTCVMWPRDRVVTPVTWRLNDFAKARIRGKVGVCCCWQNSLKSDELMNEDGWKKGSHNQINPRSWIPVESDGLLFCSVRGHWRLLQHQSRTPEHIPTSMCDPIENSGKNYITERHSVCSSRVIQDVRVPFLLDNPCRLVRCCEG